MQEQMQTHVEKPCSAPSRLPRQRHLLAIKTTSKLIRPPVAVHVAGVAGKGYNSGFASIASFCPPQP